MENQIYQTPTVEILDMENIVVMAGSTPTEEGEYQTSGTTELDDGSGDITALGKKGNPWEDLDVDELPEW